MKHLELNVNNWIKVPKLGKGSFCVSGVFDDGVTVEGHDEKIQYDDICPIEFIEGENLCCNGFTASWRYGMTFHSWCTDTTTYEWVKDIKPGYSYCTVSVNFDNYCKEYKLYYCSLDEPGNFLHPSNIYISMRCRIFL